MLISQNEFDRLAAEGKVELVGRLAFGLAFLQNTHSDIGVLVVQHYIFENAYDIRDLEFLSSVGGHIALAIERRRSKRRFARTKKCSGCFSATIAPTGSIDKETRRFLEGTMRPSNSMDIPEEFKV